MLPSSTVALVSLVFLGASPTRGPSENALCEDVRRIELAATPEAAREVCVSPGLMTGLLFDAPIVVELEDETRFLEVMRGRNGIGFVPPRDMAPGERLRLTVRFANGAAPDVIPFVLVAHQARATRQVEVYRDTRTRESYQQEVAQERARSRQLLEELERLRAERQVLKGLRGAIVNGTISMTGVQARMFRPEVDGRSVDGLSLVKGAGYRSDTSVALEVWVANSGPEPWMAVEASLMNARGEKVKGLRFWQGEAIAGNGKQQIVVEVENADDAPSGNYSLWLKEAGPRQLTIPGVTIP
ncbi:DUF2381 family protein [Archangium violaceum]|uniref:DUF2381 family protein n=1 Tax=Archangium violaceum TaxID=83451 RepID=UPI00194E042D|nr:DUF2381 family protein [Archangium violaceum]QRN96687.1 DUF2381 family protein [Archangium violaceum]